MLYICIYLAVGLVLNFWGPLSKIIKEGYDDATSFSLQDLILERKMLTKSQKIFAMMALRIIALLFYPIIYLNIFFGPLSKKKK